MWNELADLLLGASCPGCGAPGMGACARCRDALRTPPRVVTDLTTAVPVVSANGFDPALREMLSAHKDRGALTLTGLLARRLALAVAAALADFPSDGPVVLVPVPSSPAAVRRRGFDHSWALTAAVARRLRDAGLPVTARRVLRRSRAVADQSELSREQRRRNQARSLVARPAGTPCEAIVTDDICTTGASLDEAARALRAAGWTVLAGAVVAHPAPPGANCAQVIGNASGQQ